MSARCLPADTARRTSPASTDDRTTLASEEGAFSNQVGDATEARCELAGLGSDPSAMLDQCRNGSGSEGRQCFGFGDSRDYLRIQTNPGVIPLDDLIEVSQYLEELGEVRILLVEGHPDPRFSEEDDLDIDRDGRRAEVLGSNGARVGLYGAEFDGARVKNALKGGPGAGLREQVLCVEYERATRGLHQRTGMDAQMRGGGGRSIPHNIYPP